MLVFDFFAGTKSSTQPFEDAGHTVISFDNDAQFDVTVSIDLMTVDADMLIDRFGRPDFIWASPPCTAFSVASIGHHWFATGMPKTVQAEQAMELVRATRMLIETINPSRGFVIENPRGMLRKLPMLEGLQRHTVTYCQYGDDRMKPTDLWTNITGWTPRPACSNGADCHVAAPRGSQTGTQGRAGAVARSMVPYELGVEIMNAIGDVHG